MISLPNLRILPLLVVVAALSFGVRFGDFVTGVSNMSGSANAQEEAKEVMTDTKPSTEGLEEPNLAVETSDSMEKPAGDPVEASPTEPIDLSQGEKIEWRDSTDPELEFSDVKMEMFEDLKVRRKQLEDQQRELSVREALLKTAEQELDQKYKELVSLKSEIEELLVTQSEEEQKRIASLVKIYEGMKPKDAARIFNTLDLDILLSVVSKMSERKSAPIIASMSPERARTLTQMLMDQKTLSDISANLNQ